MPTGTSLWRGGSIATRAKNRLDTPVFEVSTERQAVKETTGVGARVGFGATALSTIAVCDVDLAHTSHISDDEDLRFQLGVAVYGYERDQHNGGRELEVGRRLCICGGVSVFAFVNGCHGRHQEQH